MLSPRHLEHVKLGFTKNLDKFDSDIMSRNKFYPTLFQITKSY